MELREISVPERTESEVLFESRRPPIPLARARATGHERVCRVRGQGLRSLLQAIAARWDAETVAEIVARTPENLRSTVLHADIATSGWYPVTWYSEIHRACRDVTGAPLAVAAELRAEALRIDSRGMFRFLLRFASPRALLRNYVRVCGLYLDGPRIDVAFVGRSSIDVRWSELVGYDEACVMDHVGGALAAFELCNGKNVRHSELELVWGPADHESKTLDRPFAQCEGFRLLIHWD